MLRNAWYNTPQYWIYFIGGVLFAYAYRSCNFCIV